MNRRSYGKMTVRATDVRVYVERCPKAAWYQRTESLPATLEKLAVWATHDLFERLKVKEYELIVAGTKDSKETIAKTFGCYVKDTIEDVVNSHRDYRVQRAEGREFDVEFFQEHLKKQGIEDQLPIIYANCAKRVELWSGTLDFLTEKKQKEPSGFVTADKYLKSYDNLYDKNLNIVARPDIIPFSDGQFYILDVKKMKRGPELADKVQNIVGYLAVCKNAEALAEKLGVTLDPVTPVSRVTRFSSYWDGKEHFVIMFDNEIELVKNIIKDINKWNCTEACKNGEEEEKDYHPFTPAWLNEHKESISKNCTWCDWKGRCLDRSG